ncbi:signal peptidase II [Cohnella laeviribosi]|uniref:signal peptidase II n=1 Tax=Cohnella laeviribosi TaxID=380174 RepID=UPI00037A8D7B|nr:signal peptidase II [Cohnella laeviribosi]
MLYFYLLSLFVYIIDQLIKWAVVRNMRVGESISMIDGIISLTSHRNRGAAFGILQNQTWFLVLFTVVAIVFLIYYLQKVHRSNKTAAYGLSLVLGGAFGNFTDRLARGEVVDMIEVNFIDYPIFNMADSFIFIGCIILFAGSWRKVKKEVT